LFLQHLNRSNGFFLVICMKKMVIAIASVLIVMMLVGSAGAQSAEERLRNWEAGDEAEHLDGHTFDEEMFSVDVTNKNENGDNVTSSVSYLNIDDSVQACMLALNNVENENGTAVLPYQLFAMHYVNPFGKDVFMGANLAFLLAYNDTNGNGLPDWGDPDEPNPFYIIPFGLSQELNDLFPEFADENNSPVVTHIEMHKVEHNHYRCGMRYENMWAIATQSVFWSAVFKMAWLAKFSEMEITYDIHIDEENGEVSTETFYTIGEITDLYAVWGAANHHFETEQVHEELLTEDWGLAAVHFTTTFTSKYTVDEDTDQEGHKFSTEIDNPKALVGDLVWGVDNGRFFAIGFRGDYDVINEGTDETLIDDGEAINVLVPAQRLDLGLVLWQLGINIGQMSVLAYGLSTDVRSKYSDPMDLIDRSLKWGNKDGFRAAPVWYGVCFPNWQGYRIEHDPVYTAFVDFDQISIGSELDLEEEKEEDSSGCGSAIIIGAIVSTSCSFGFIKRKKKDWQ